MRRTITSLIAATAVVGSMLAASPATAGGAATVNVIHGIPGVAVKVCVNGARVVDDFTYTERIVGATLPARTHHVKLVAAGERCTHEAILKERFTLSEDADYTIVATLSAGGDPNLIAFRNRVGRTPHGEARVTIRHTAAAPAVNVWANGAVLIGGDAFTWGDSATALVPAGQYRVKVTLPGERIPVIGPKHRPFRAGNAYQAYAVGSEGKYRIVVIRTHVGQR